jgi:hypothetical protein
MDFSIMLFGETEEGVETQDAVREKVERFAKSLGSFGYPCKATTRFGGCCEEDLPFVEGPIHIVDGYGIEPGDVTNTVMHVYGVSGSGPLPTGTSVVDPEDDLKARILALRDAADNGINSQREIAEALGVTRYQVRKVLEGVEG